MKTVTIVLVVVAIAAVLGAAWYIWQNSGPPVLAPSVPLTVEQSAGIQRAATSVGITGLRLYGERDGTIHQITPL